MAEIQVSMSRLCQVGIQSSDAVVKKLMLIKQTCRIQLNTELLCACSTNFSRLFINRRSTELPMMLGCSTAHLGEHLVPVLAC